MLKPSESRSYLSNLIESHRITLHFSEFLEQLFDQSLRNTGRIEFVETAHPPFEKIKKWRPKVRTTGRKTSNKQHFLNAISYGSSSTVLTCGRIIKVFL